MAPDPAADRLPAGGERPPRAAPPDRRRAWTAEIEWRESDADGVFRVVGRPDGGSGDVTIGESARIDWPPKGAAAVEALRQAPKQLEAALLAAGWRSLPPGDKWYARRFAWTAETPEPSLAPAPRLGRFERGPAWPADTAELWRCEIRWDPGYVNSSFKALAFAPGKRRGKTVGESAAFKWLMLESPDPQEAAIVAEVRSLAAALVEAGWQPIRRGPHWFSGRYVWRREEPPPDHVELAPAGQDAQQS
jgi:hypothetical protein